MQNYRNREKSYYILQGIGSSYENRGTRVETSTETGEAEIQLNSQTEMLLSSSFGLKNDLETGKKEDSVRENEEIGYIATTVKDEQTDDNNNLSDDLVD